MERRQKAERGIERKKKAPGSVDQYIRSFPGQFQKKLQELRALIRTEAPQAQERLSYHMPAFFLSRNLVYFAAHSKHIGFYPGAGAIRAFEKRLSHYKHAKGSIQFPIEKALPKGLIKEIVRFKVEQIMSRGKR